MCHEAIFFQKATASVKGRILLVSAAVLLLAAVAVGIWYFAVQLPQQQAHAAVIEALQAYYNDKVTLFEKENAQYTTGQVDVVFLGDSLTDGYPVTEYYSEYMVVNRGIGGDTTYGLEDRLQVSVYDLQPKVAVMLIGANNMQTMFDNYERILQGLQENLPNTKIVLLSLTAMGRDWGRNNHLAAFNNVKIKKLAKEYGFAYVDLYTPLLDLRTNEIYEAYTTDGGHLTQQGYQVVTDALLPVLDALLQGNKS